MSWRRCLRDELQTDDVILCLKIWWVDDGEDGVCKCVRWEHIQWHCVLLVNTMTLSCGALHDNRREFEMTLSVFISFRDHKLRLNIFNNKVSPLCQGDLERAFCNSRMVTNAFLSTTKIFHVSVCLSMFLFVCSGRWRSGEASHWWLSIGCHLWPCKGEVMKN